MCTVSTSKQAGTDERSGYHHGNLREALLEQGLALLEQRLDSDFSLRELARRVGVSPNATYRHFANKEALIQAMAAEGVRRLERAQTQSWQHAQGDVARRFLATGCAYVRFARQCPALFRLMFGRFVSEHRSDAFDQAAAQAFAGLRQGVAAALGLAPESEQTRLAAYNAWAVVHGFSYLILDGQIAGTDEEIEAIVEQALGLWLQSVRQQDAAG